MCRSCWKPCFFDKSVLKIFHFNKKKVHAKKIKYIRVFSRRSCISNFFLDLLFGVHNGKNFIFFFILKDYLNFKFGEYSFSKKRSNLIHLYNRINKKKLALKKKN